MDRGSVDIIESWDSRPLSDGLEGLTSLEHSEFTGAVSAAGAWLFMLNGNVIGVFNGDIDSFREASGTVYQAPDPAIVLLFSMQESGGETQAQYFTDDNPIREVHSTLTDSGFTGYLQLSENVISGDYFVLYYGGRSMNVAFVGNSRRVVTGDEAFELATEEVGIYEVVSVDISVLDIPTPEEPTVNSGESSSTASIDNTDQSPTTADESTSGTEASPAGLDTEPEGPPAGVEPDQSQESEPEPAAEHTDEDPVSASDAEPTQPTSESDLDQNESHDETEPSVSDSDGDSDNPSSTDQHLNQEQTTRPGPADEHNDRFSEEEEWRKTRSIPALDPDDSSVQPEQANEETARQSTQKSVTDDPGRSRQLSEVEDRIQRQQQKIESLAEKVEELEDERNKLESERNALQSELQQRQQQEASSEPPSQSSHSVSLSPAEALEQTDLFIRYNSKSDATLEDVRYGDIDQEALASNLNLETHTRFSIDETVVNDQSFRDFLSNRIEYQFVNWVTSELPFEIRNTGNEAPLKELYHLLPRIDRVELNGELEGTNADEEDITRAFDVIIRDRMGEPLLVANINHERDPADAAMMEKLTDDASAVTFSHDNLGGAFFVTASFFTPEALETAAEATGGGFLSRDKRKNYVKLSRKNGFHLCLIEARENAFHITSPEL